MAKFMTEFLQMFAFMWATSIMSIYAVYLLICFVGWFPPGFDPDAAGLVVRITAVLAGFMGLAYALDDDK